MKTLKARGALFGHLGEFGIVMAVGLSVAAIAATILGLF
jgi:hypothetical protein